MVAAADEATATQPIGEDTATASRGRLVLRRFLRRKLAVFGLVMVVLLFVMAFVGPHFAKWRYDQLDYFAIYQKPNGSHWFGTTQIGEDVFAQTMRGMQKSLIIGLLGAFLTTGT